MPDDNLVIGADASGLVNALNQVMASLQKFYDAEDDAIKKTVQYNAATGQLANTWALLGDKGKILANVTFKQLNDAIDKNSIAIRGDEQAVASLDKELDKLNAKLALSAAKAGEFKNAMTLAGKIQSPELAAKVTTKITGLQDIEAETRRVADNLRRNLGRGFEDSMKNLEPAFKLQLLGMRRDVAKTAAEMGLDWTQLSTKIKSVAAGDVKLLPPGAAADFQDQLIAYTNGMKQMQNANQRRVEADVSASAQAQAARIKEINTQIQYAKTQQQQQNVAASQQAAVTLQQALRGSLGGKLDTATLDKQINIKGLEQQVAQSAAKMGLSWDQLNAKMAVIKSGKFEPLSDADQNKFQLLLAKYVKGLDSLQAKEQGRVQVAGATAEQLLGIQRNFFGQQLSSITKLQDVGIKQDIFKGIREGLGNLVSADLPQRVQGRLTQTAGALAKFAADNKISVEATLAQVDRLRGGGPLQVFDPKSTEANLQKLANNFVLAEQAGNKFRSGMQNQVTAAKDYTTLLGEINSGLVTVTKRQADYSSETKKTVETYRGVTKAGEDFTASVVKMDGKVTSFKRSLSSIAPDMEANAAAQQRQTLAQQDATKFMDQLNSKQLQQLSYTKQYSSATGQLTETYNTVNKAGQQQITTVQRQGEAIKNFTQVTYDQTKANEQLMLSWQSIIRMFTMQLLYQSMANVLGLIRQSIDAAAALQVQVAQIQTISESGMDTRQWVKGITDISNATGLLANDVASGLYNTLSNQIADGGKSLEFLSAAGKFAITTNSSMQDSINAISSAINSYGLKAQDATRISDVFFRMIDLGRINTKDFANEIGKLYPLAAQLGISMEEVSAVLTTLTRSGVTPAAAMTSLFNIMSRMIKPAGEMKDFFTGIGVSSAQSAIQMSNFASVLGKMTEFTQGRPELAAQLYPDIRGLRGFAKLGTEAGIAEFRGDLDKLKNSVGAVDKAFQYFTGNAGKQFQIEINKIKNYFTGAWGQGIVEGFATLQKTGITLTGILKTVANGLLFVGGPLVIGGIYELAKASAIARTAFTALAATAVGPLAALAAALTAAALAADYYADRVEQAARDSEDAYAKAAEAAKKTAGEGFKTFDESTSNSFKQIRVVVAEYTKMFNELEGNLTKTAEITNDNFKELSDALKTYFSDVLNQAKTLLREIETDLKNLKGFAESLPEGLRQAQLAAQLVTAKDDPVKQQQLLQAELDRTYELLAKTYDPTRIKEYFKSAEDQVKALNKLQEDNQKNNTKINDDREKSYQRLLDLQRDEQQLQEAAIIARRQDRKEIEELAKQKGQTVVTRNGELVPSGTQDDASRQLARKQQLDEEKRVEAIEKNRREQAKERKNLAEGTKAVELSILDILTMQINMYDKMNKQTQEAIKFKEQERIKQEAIVTEMENTNKAIARSINEVQNFKFPQLFKADDIGKFDNLFVPAIADIEKLRNLIIANTKDDFKRRAELLANLDTKERELFAARKLFEQEANAKAALDSVNQLEEAFKKQREAVLKAQEDAAQAKVGYSQSRQDYVDPFLLQITRLGEFGRVGAATIQGVKDALEQLLKDTTSKTLENFQNALRKFDLESLQDARFFGVDTDTHDIQMGDNRTAEALVTFSNSIIKKDEEAKKQTEGLAALKNQLDTQIKTLSQAMQLDLTKINLQEKANEQQATANDIMANLTKALVNMRNQAAGVGGEPLTIEGINKTDADRRKASEELDRKIREKQLGLPAAVPIKVGTEATPLTNPETVKAFVGLPAAIEDIYRRVTTGVTDSMKPIMLQQVSAVEQQQTSADNMASEIRMLRAAIVANTNKPTVVVSAGEIQLPPKPPELKAMGGFMHGQDTIPAMLSKGEFVVNAAATRRFYSQLVAMNGVQGFARGGLVTNVGDINVTMQASGSTQSDIVAIGKGLQREIRRGRIRF